MLVLGILVFSCAFAVAVGTIAMSVGPQWQRILSLAMGNVEPPFAPLHTLAVAERRIAIRRWASAPVPAPIRRMAAAA